MEDFIAQIRSLIEDNDLKTAFEKLKSMLENSPLTTKLIMLKARFSDIMDQITSGVVDFEEASVEKNKIRFGLTILLEEIDEIKTQNPEAKQELEKAISIVNSKNTVVGSSISAGGAVNIGDQTKGAPEIKDTKTKSNKTLLYGGLGFLGIIIIIVLIWFLFKS